MLLAALTVIVEVVANVPELVVRVMVDEPAPASVAGLKLAVTPALRFGAVLKDYAGMNETFKGRFGENPPVRTTIAAAGGFQGTRCWRST